MSKRKIVVTLEEVMEKHGIKTQKELLNLVKEKTGEDLRAATVSDIFNDKGKAINRNYLEIIAEALEITDLNELVRFDRSDSAK